MPVSGMHEFEAAMNGVIADAEAAARAVVIDAAALLEATAKRNFEGVRRRVRNPQTGKYQIVPPQHIGPKGGRPNVITGTLRRSILSHPAERVGLGTWRTKVGPTAVYARRIELEYDYPFFGPAVDVVRPRMQQIARKYWAAALVKAGH